MDACNSSRCYSPTQRTLRAFVGGDKEGYDKRITAIDSVELVSEYVA